MATSTTPSSLPGDEPHLGEPRLDEVPPVGGGDGENESSLSTRTIVEWIVVVAGAVLVALVLKTFVVQAFFIPSESMQPTLFVDDRVLVSKITYRLRDVKRGDIVVFEHPTTVERGTENKDLIKRVIALPGESLFFEGGQVHVNGQLLAEPYLPPGTETDPAPANEAYERDGSRHQCTRLEPCVVPAEALWVMGDNRPRSQDSRYIGPVPLSEVIGRSFVIIWPPSRIGGL